MDPPKPVVYFLPTRLDTDELRQWADRAASIVWVTRAASEADFIVGKSMVLPPTPPISSRLHFFPTGDIKCVPYKLHGGRTFKYRAQSLDLCSQKE